MKPSKWDDEISIHVSSNQSYDLMKDDVDSMHEASVPNSYSMSSPLALTPHQNLVSANISGINNLQDNSKAFKENSIMEAKSEYEAHGIKQCSVPYTRGSNFQQEEISQINRNNKLAQLKDNDLDQSSWRYDQSFSTPRSVSDFSPFISW